MSVLNNVAAIVEAIVQQWGKIKEQTGDEWLELEPMLLVALRDLAEAENEEQAVSLVTEVLFIGFYTPAGSIFRKILQAYPLDGGLVEVSRLGDRFTENGEKSLEAMDISDTVALDTLKRSVAEIVEQLQTEIPSTMGEAPEARYLNAGFFNTTGQYVDPLQPLSLDQGRYQLVINIGKPWGPGTTDEKWPDELLRQAFAKAVVLDLEVVVSSHPDLAFEVAIQKLHLAANGDSEFCYFPFIIHKAGRKFINIDILLNGHLLQSRFLEVQVVAPTDEPDQNWPIQYSYITWTRAAILTPESLQPLKEKPRRLTIALGRREDQVGLRFFINSSQELAFQGYELTESGLQNLITEIRSQLFRLMGGYHVVGGSLATLLEYLAPVAELGNAFFRNLFPPDEDYSPVVYNALKLEPGQIIQVAPLAKQLSIPWEAIYDRPIESYDPVRIRLCESYRQHGSLLIDCPHQNDPTVLCPHGFWGFRYIIEQLPYKVDPNESLPAPDVSLQVRNRIPLHMNAILHTNFNQLSQHLQRLRNLSTNLTVTEIWDKETAKQALQDQATPADMIYFYTHGGMDRRQSYLVVGENQQIKEADLSAWRLSFWQQRPLIIINACESAAYNLGSFENMLQFFTRHGAAGVIGTQCPVLELLADAMILRFFHAFWQQLPAGQALYQARRDLLFADEPDPRGLAYSLFASADVQLAQPLIIRR